MMVDINPVKSRNSTKLQILTKRQLPYCPGTGTRKVKPLRKDGITGDLRLLRYWRLRRKAAIVLVKSFQGVSSGETG